MGAQTDDRLIQYKKRFKDWEDPNGESETPVDDLLAVLVMLKHLKHVCFFTGETPAYHYGTHYSSAMIVASYLIRMEPFTQIFLRLQVSPTWPALFFICCFLLFTQCFSCCLKFFITNQVQIVKTVWLDWTVLSWAVLSLFFYSSTSIFMLVEIYFAMNVTK